MVAIFSQPVARPAERVILLAHLLDIVNIVNIVNNIIFIIIIFFFIIIFFLIIMFIKWGVGTRCVPTPKMAYFSVFKAFLFLKYFKNNLGLIESSFNP